MILMLPLTIRASNRNSGGSPRGSTSMLRVWFASVLSSTVARSGSPSQLGARVVLNSILVRCCRVRAVDSRPYSPVRTIRCLTSRGGFQPFLVVGNPQT